jgi:dTDP-4-dehydrorhamnose reductase
MEKLKKGEKVNIVDDVYENFLFNLDCARTIWLLIKSDKKGIYHIAGRDVVNRYEFAKIVAEVFGLPGDLIQAVSSDFFPGLAPRPRNTSYNTAKVERELGIKPLGIREGLLLMRKDAGLSCPR